MLFQPHLPPELRQRRIVAERPQQMAPLEATGTLPAVADTMGRGSSLPTSSVTTHPGCTMRVSVAPALRRCQSHARNREDLARGKCSGWLEKVGAAIKPQNKTAAPLILRQNRMVLPQISKGGNKDSEKPAQKWPRLPACSCRARGAPPGNEDVTPWSGPSQSEASFHAFFRPVVSFLHSVPFSAAGAPGPCSFSPAPGEAALDPAGERTRKAQLPRGQARQKGRSRAPPQRFRSKWQGVTLPPLPTISNLSFSRNFTFSFFELPPHQHRQHRVQRQQLICLLMKQLRQPGSQPCRPPGTVAATL
ncbi:hypothetical protein lerEdw1_015544 [Lerista edwardsae]|nr:hypothetical protein lerEdw1_015544 [Lerista edwardsae]